jgi:hypothetical protein
MRLLSSSWKYQCGFMWGESLCKLAVCDQKIITLLNKIVIPCMRPYFWSWNVHVCRALTCIICNRPHFSHNSYQDSCVMVVEATSSCIEVCVWKFEVGFQWNCVDQRQSDSECWVIRRCLVRSAVSGDGMLRVYSEVWRHFVRRNGSGGWRC